MPMPAVERPRASADRRVVPRCLERGRWRRARGLAGERRRSRPVAVLPCDPVVAAVDPAPPVYRNRSQPSFLRAFGPERLEPILLQPQTTGFVDFKFGRLEASSPKIDREK